MGIMTSEWQERVGHWTRTLAKDFYEPLAPLSWEAFLTMDYLTLEEAKQQSYRAVEPGFTWGHTWEYGWFRTVLTLPPAAAGKRIVLDLGLDGEATLFVNDRAFGTYRADWVDEPHHFMEDNYLTRDGKPGQQFEVYMEVYAGHYFPAMGMRDGHTATGPVIEGDYEDPLPEGARRVLGESTFGIWNEDAYQLYMDVMTLTELLPELDETSLRAAKIAEALEQFTLTVDFEQDREGRIRDYRAAREGLAAVMGSRNGSTVPKFYAVGNAHIDLAWLWPMAETCRKTARTFAAQLRLLDEYPDYKFIQSQPASYEMCREHYPELFARILEAHREGRWIADGAMWVEPDTNMTSGESLIRQLLYGKKYYKEVFGTDSEVLWLPDTFGYTAALPQILQSCGVKYLVTQKIFWSYNGGEQFPYHYFAWEGMDGTKVTTFLPTSYTYRTSPREANNVWRSRSQMRDLEAFLYPFGYGDGGGGPCRDHIEYARRYRDLEGSVKMEMAGPREFFADMDALGGPKNTYVGELYFTAHRGTYTSQASIKRNNRKGELAMRELEFWGALAQLAGTAYPTAEAEAMWKVILLHQFHDILPGSSIARVYEEANAAFAKLFVEADTRLHTALAGLTEEADGVTVWNSLGFARKAVVALPEEYRGGAEADGTLLPVYEGENGLQAVVTLPAFGAVSLVPAKAPAAPAPVSLVRTEEGYVFENRCLRAVVDGSGAVVSFRLKEADGRLTAREFAAGSMNRFRLFKDVPRRYDAWDVDSNYVDQEITPAVSQVSCEIVRASGAEVLLRVSGTIDRSSYTQLIRLQAESRRLEFETRVSWKEQHRLLKVAFPVQVYAEEGINEMQFGYVKRPTHRSRLYDKDRFEVCNHRYSALCDESHGAAVLNDCKYGISMNGNALELTLLRAATAPDRHADQGEHIFTYAFTAWEGSFLDSDVVRQGYELNVTPPVTKGSRKTFGAFAVDADNVMLETVKPAADGSGDLILRLYESKKAETFAELTIALDALGVSAAAYDLYDCNMLEEVGEQLSAADGRVKLHFRPFEIRTLRLVRR